MESMIESLINLFLPIATDETRADERGVSPFLSAVALSLSNGAKADELRVILSGDGTYDLGHIPRVVLWRFGSALMDRGNQSESDLIQTLPIDSSTFQEIMAFRYLREIWQRNLGEGNRLFLCLSFFCAPSPNQHQATWLEVDAVHFCGNISLSVADCGRDFDIRFHGLVFCRSVYSPQLN